MIWDSEYSTKWRTKFAWFPVYINREHKIWLQKYQIRYAPGDEKECEFCRDTIGQWETRFYEPPCNGG